MDEAQLSALISAAVKEAVERTTRELAAKHEADTEGLRRKRDELLDKVAKKPTDDFDSTLARIDRQIAALKGQPTGQPAASSSVREHTITREQARSGQAYREAKDAAEKAGVPLRIVDENAPAQQKRGSPVKLVHDEIGGVLHANIELVEKHGQQRMRALAAEKGAQLRVFRSADDLPDEAAAKHADIIASGDRSNLL